MAHCTGYVMAGETGMTYCKSTPIAAYTWDGVPFNYKGKPGAAVCVGHENQLKRDEAKYPGLKLVERIGAYIHVFEEAGLGKAPFKFVDVITKVGPYLLSREGGVEHWVGAPGQPVGTCRFCGNVIANCCVIRDRDGKTFEVGSDCVFKVAVNDKTMVSAVRKAVNAKAKETRHERENARIAWAAINLPRVEAAWKGQPHPYKYMADDGKSLWDWATWMLANAGNRGKLEVVKKLEELLGEKAKKTP